MHNEEYSKILSMKYLVTGGAGFIGSHLVNKLINAGNHVVVVDNLSTGNFRDVNPEAEFLNIDLSDEKNLSLLPNDINIVYHLASQVSGEVSVEDPLFDLMGNSYSTLALLEWSKHCSIKKFIFTSSMGVYYDQLNQAAHESSILVPKSFYGINKQASEGYIRIASEEGLRTTIVRLFNVYGPGQNMSNYKQGMLSIYMAYVYNKQPIIIKGPLDRIRDFVYVHDVINALMLCRDEKADGKIFNVCSGRKTMVKKLIKLIQRAFDEGDDYPIKILERTPRDIDACWGDYSKIKRELGWEPKVNLEEGIAKMINWLRNGV